MRILLCHNHYREPGGEDTVFEAEGALLESRGHDVVRFTKHNDEIDDISPAALAAKTVWNSACARELTAVIRDMRPDVMHCTNTFPLLSPSAYAAASRERVAVVQSLHNYRLICPNAQLVRNGRICERCIGMTFAWPALVHRCYRNSLTATAVAAGMAALHKGRGTSQTMVDCFVTPSAFAREKLVTGGLPADRIVVKPNFVWPDPGVGRGRGGYTVFVGRLSPEKGVDVLLDAWARLESNLELKIIGDGPLAGDVERAARADERIRWLGHCAQHRVREIVGDAACLVMPSVCYETFGMVIVEAFAKGTPVVASRLGAMAELVEEGTTGMLFDAGNPDDLAEKVQQLTHDTSLNTHFRVSARSAFEEHYTADANYELLVDIYERALWNMANRLGLSDVVGSESRVPVSGGVR